MERGYEYWLYEQHYDDLAEFYQYVNNFLVTAKGKINILIVNCEESIKKELDDWEPQNFKVKTSGKDNFFKLEITKLFEDRQADELRKDLVKARVIKYQDYPLYLIFSECTKTKFKNIITKLMNKHYPNISRLFLTNNEIKNICNQLERDTRNEILVEFSHAKKRLFGSKKKKISQMTYTHEHFSTVFEKIYTFNQWIESIRFSARVVVNAETGKVSEPKYQGVLSRGCFFSAELRFSPFIDIIIPYAIKFAYGKNEYLKVRSLRASQENPEPIVINFQDDIFSDIAENKNFVDAFYDLDKVSVSSYHSNPYIHLSLLDYLDGSSYDLWVVSQNRLIIYPQFSASTASMNRIVNHIYERIREGVIEEFKDIELPQ